MSGSFFGVRAEEPARFVSDPGGVEAFDDFLFFDAMMSFSFFPMTEK